MDQRVKELWTAALRSGEFVQGHGQLRKIVDGKPHDCCLGVLCELYRREFPTLAHWNEGAFETAFETGDEGCGHDDYEQCSHSESSELPEQVVEWAGLNESDPLMGDYTAASHNDGAAGTDTDAANHCAPKTFTKIADLIEEYL